MGIGTKGHQNRWRGLLFICVSLLVISLDNTILNVALPSISRDLGASASELQWIVDSYILVFAALLLTMGAVGDRFGRKRALQIGVITFGIFSLMAALSTSTEMLIVARALLGIGGALIMPATLSLVTAMFRDPKERAQAIAIWAAVFGLGIGIGPLIGGYLIEYYDWNTVFLVNLPVAAIALVGGHLYLQESRDKNAPPPDIPGVVLSFGGLLVLVYGIIEAGQDGWGADHVVGSFVAATVLLAVFFWWEWRTPHAMLPLGFFRNMSFTGANVAMTMMMFGMFGATFFMSQYFQSVQGYSPLETGWRLLPMALVIMVAAGMSARVSARIGTKLTVGIGFMIAAAGMLYLSQFSTAGASYGTILVGMAIMASGMGTAMSPATNSIMSAVPVDKAGVGSAMNDTTRQIGGALGVAVLGTLMNDTYLDQIAGLKTQLAGDVPPGALAVIESSIQGAHGVAAQIGGPVAQIIIDTANKAFVGGMTDAMFAAAIIMAGASLFTFLVLPAHAHNMDAEDSAEPEK
ncbi:MAG: MFS transporter, partial [Anaerolineae bacterium]|nr:MFS transporter [Anaerolineae bacterium]